MNSLLPSIIRTVVPIVVTAIATFLAAANIDLGPEGYSALTAFLGALIGAVYYVVVRFLEQKFPWVGNFLGSAKKPVYTEPAATPPYTPADLDRTNGV